MAGSVVQSDSDEASGDSDLSVNFGSTVTIGNRVFVHSSIFQGGGSPASTVSDNQGHTYSLVREITGLQGGNVIHCMHVSEVIDTSSGTFTVTVDFGASSDVVIGIMEVSGLDATGSALRTSGITTNTTDEATSTTATTDASSPVSGDFIIGSILVAIGSQSDVEIGVATTGYTQHIIHNNYTSFNSLGVDTKDSGSGTQTATWTHLQLNEGGGNEAAAIISVWKLPSAGGRIMSSLVAGGGLASKGGIAGQGGGLAG